MIDIKRRMIDHQVAIEIELKLPFTPVFLLMNTKGYLCGKIFNRFEIEKSQACICIMEESRNIAQLLESRVIYRNNRAEIRGIEVGESGQSAILKMYEEAY